MNYADRITKLLLITLVLSLGFGQLLRFELWGLPLYLHDLLTLALILLLSLQGQALKAPLWFKLIAAGLTLGAIRALFLFPIYYLPIPLLYSLRLLAYLTLYISLLHTPFAISRKLFLLAGLIPLAIGLAQYFLMPDMRLFQYLGWDDHLSRLTLPHFDPTFTGAMLALFLFSSLQFSIIRYSLFIILYAIGVLLTYSRSIWLSLAFTTFVFTKRKISTLFVICSLLFVVFVALPRQFGEGTNLLRTYSITSRLTNDLQLASRVGWNFVLGTGYNTLPLLSPSDSLYPSHATGFNNSYLTIFATSGIVGLAGWFLFIQSLYRRHVSLRPALTFVLIGSLFNNLLLYPFVLIYLILISVFKN